MYEEPDVKPTKAMMEFLRRIPKVNSPAELFELYKENHKSIQDYKGGINEDKSKSRL